MRSWRRGFCVVEGRGSASAASQGVERDETERSVTPGSAAPDDSDLISLLSGRAETPHDFALGDDLAELTSVVEGMTSRDLQICLRIVLAVIDMSQRLGAAETNAALARAVQDMERASMI